MGYQESYVKLTDSERFEELVSLTKTLGENFFNNQILALPCEIITLQKPIEGNLQGMCHPEIPYSFSAGEKFIYFCGERSGQRSPMCMYSHYAPENLEIYFTECFPSNEIFDKNSGYAKHEEFEWN